jgi:hypothetical protein
MANDTAKLNAFQTMVLNRIQDARKAEKLSNEYTVISKDAVIPFVPPYYVPEYSGRRDSVTLLFSDSPNPIEIFPAPKGQRVGALPTISTYKENNKVSGADTGLVADTTMYALVHAHLFRNVRGFRAPKLAEAKASPAVVQGGAFAERRTAPALHSVSNRNEARQRLADAAKALSQVDSVKHKLEELKRDAQCLEKPDFVWLSLVESFSSMGNSRGYDGLFGNPENYKKITYEALSSLSPDGRLGALAKTLGAAAVRMPDRKAEWLAAAFKQIESMGGPAEAKAKLLREPGRDAKIAFLERFDGIGPKYARNIFMNVYHLEFRQCIAVDSRIESVLTELGLKELKSYESREQFLLEVAKEAGIDGWDLDRMIYNFKYEISARLNA